jgi:hypothetical protein
VATLKQFAVTFLTRIWKNLSDYRKAMIESGCSVKNKRISNLSSARMMVKVDVKLSLCFIKHHEKKDVLGMEVRLRIFTTALDEGEWLDSRPRRFTSGN